MFKTPTLTEELYMTYQVEPRKIPQESPSTSEIIGYDIEYPEFTELKCYRVLKCLFEIDIRLDIDINGEDNYSIMVQGNSKSDWDFLFTEDDKSLEDCVIKVLITLYDELPEHYQLRIRKMLMEE